MNEQNTKTVEAMEKYGGSFVKALAGCFWRADHLNFAKLRDTFSDYFEKYEEIAKKKK